MTVPYKVRAIEVLEENYDEVCDFCGEVLEKDMLCEDIFDGVYVDTEDGEDVANVGDFIVDDPRRGLLVVRENEFDDRYRPCKD